MTENSAENRGLGSGEGSDAVVPNEEAVAAESASPSGAWEKTGKVVNATGRAVDAADRAVNATTNVIAKLYGVLLFVISVVIVIFAPSVWWAGLIVAAYGVYLVWPGGKKWVIY